jgi:hypothetical protein
LFELKKNKYEIQMAQKVGDMVDITPGTETAERVTDPEENVGVQLTNALGEDAAKKIMSDKGWLKGWEVVKVDDGKGPVPGLPNVNIRKMENGEDLYLAVVKPGDLVEPSTGGKRRTRKGKKSTKKSRKLRKLRKTRGRKH